MTYHDDFAARTKELVRFGGFLTMRFADSTATFAAYRLGEFTVVVARGGRAFDLEDFVETEFDGWVQDVPAPVGAGADAT